MSCLLHLLATYSLDFQNNNLSHSIRKTINEIGRIIMKNVLEHDAAYTFFSIINGTLDIIR